MKNNNQNTWVGVKDLSKDPEFIEDQKSEFKALPVVGNMGDDKSFELKSNRRDFLKYLGFSVGAATVAAACETPVRRAIPYVVKPDAIVPGVATYYASSYVNGGDYCPILVKTREGRPIKIEGNNLSSLTHGGTSARAQAHVLSLYDTSRYRGPQMMTDGAASDSSWSDLDNAWSNAVNAGSRIGIISSTIMSPTSLKAIADFKANYANTQVAIYDPVSAAAQLGVMKQKTGSRALPTYHFDKADIIVSFNADFLGSWVSPVAFAHDYAKRRRIKDVKNPNMSWHVQVESRMSLTGSNADNRILVKPSEQDAAIAYLYRALGGSAQVSTDINAEAAKALDRVANKLKAAAGKSLVISASNNALTQEYVHNINERLGNYGTAISIESKGYQRQGDERSLKAMIRSMENGQIDALIVMGANPAFDNPDAGAFTTAMSKVPFAVSTALTPDETAILCNAVAPDHHGLESWGDALPQQGHLSILQPTIQALFNTRKAEVSLLNWAGRAKDLDREQPYYSYMQKCWQENIFPAQSKYGQFQMFWDQVIRDGVSDVSIELADALADFAAPSTGRGIATVSSSGNDLEFYESVNMGSGQQANNPWLMEMPDPVMRTAWGNYLAVPITWEGGKEYTTYQNLAEGDYSTLSAGDNELTATVFTQFGQMPETAALAIGYGREVVGAAGAGIGVNVYPWGQSNDDGFWQHYRSGVEISGKVGADDEYASVQYHHSMGVTDTDPETGETVNVDEITAPALIEGYQGSLTKRTVIRRSNVRELDSFVHDLHEERHHHQKLNDYTLYPWEEYSKTQYGEGHHWGLYIDLNACTGCGACTVACMAENNVPVVGKKEVHRHHEMSWLRIDRYFYGDVNNPNTVYQPLMCQHCDNAPCENVCPVAATNHSSEGLNQMTYNRCIGTRYCANNCPYKVRRFNWLDYTTADLFASNEPDLNGGEMYGQDNLTRMVLNPDVTVRSRGVIEKCSFCVQRIQEGKLTAKIENRAVRDGDIKSACQTACPTGAITFGDFNDKKGSMMEQVESPLTYQVLEEINVRPSVNYASKINNRDEALDA